MKKKRKKYERKQADFDFERKSIVMNGCQNYKACTQRSNHVSGRQCMKPEARKKLVHM